MSADCTVSWCVGQREPRACAGRDHMAVVETVTVSGDPRRLDDLRVCAGTISEYRQDVVSVVSHDDRWSAELRPSEARQLAETLLRHVALLETEPGVLG